MRKLLLACNNLNRELIFLFFLKSKILTKSITLVVLCVTLGFNCYSQTLEDVNVFGCRGLWDYGNGIVYDDLGNIYVTGIIDGHSQFDDQIVMAKDFGDAYIAKYNHSGNLLWVKTLNGTKKEVGNEIVYKEGYLYLSGTFSDTINLTGQHITNGYDDIFITKMDTSGNYIWSKSFGGVSSERTNGLKLDNSGNLYLYGYCRHPFSFEGYDFTFEGRDNFYFIKFDINGNVIWAKEAAGSGNINLISIDISSRGIIALSGGYRGECILGDSVFSSTGMGFISFYDTDFNFIKAKSSKGVGGHIVLDVDTNIYITGNFSDTLAINDSIVIAGSSQRQIFIVKLNWALEPQWIKIAGSKSEDLASMNSNYVTSIKLFDDKLYIGGEVGPNAVFSNNIYTSYNQDNSFLASYKLSGNLNWVSSFISDGSTFVTDIDISEDGEPVITGKFSRSLKSDTTLFTALGSGEMFIIKYGTGQNYEWAKKAGSGGWDEGSDICFDNDGNYYVLGDFDGINVFQDILYKSNGLDDIYLMKFNKDDEIIWIKTFGGLWDEEAGSVAVDSLGNIYLTGSFCGEVKFDSFTVIPEGNEDFFLCQLNKSGDIQWVKQYKSSYYYINPKIKTDKQNNAYLAFSAFTYNIQIEDTVINNSRRDLIIVKYEKNGDFVWVRASSGAGIKENNNFRIYNNNLYLTGRFKGEFRFEDTLVNSNLQNHGYVIKLDLNGNLKNFSTIESSIYASLNDILVNKYGNIYVAGNYRESIEFGDSTYTTTNYFGDIFICRYNDAFKEDAIYLPKSSSPGSASSYLSLQQDQVSNIYLLGASNAKTDFSNSVTMPSSMSDRIFCVKFDKELESQWITYNSNYGWAGGNSMALRKDVCYFTGSVPNITSFESFSFSNYSSYGTQHDAIIGKIKFDCLPVGPAGNMKLEETSNQFEKTLIADINNAIDYVWEMPEGVEIINSDFFNDTIQISISETFSFSNICVYGINECGDKSQTLSYFLNFSNNCYSFIDTSICEGMSYFVEGMEYTSAGTYYDTVKNVGDCDSIIVTTLKINTVYNLTETFLITSDESYTFPDGTVQNNITSQVVYTSNLQTTHGCDSTIETTVNVNSNSNDITYLTDTICEGDSIQIGYVICTGTGVYGVTLTNQFGCDSMVYLDLTVIDIDVNLGRDETIDINDTIILDAGENFETYYWNTKETSQTILIDSSYGVGSHTFNVLVTDENDCTETDNITITISDVTDISFNDQFEGDIKLYPNPTSGKINIDLTEINEPIEISIFDIAGTILLHKELNSNESSLVVEIPGNNGIYFIKLGSGLKSKTYKIIKD